MRLDDSICNTGTPSAIAYVLLMNSSLGSTNWCCDRFRYAFEQRRERGLFSFAKPPVENITSEPSFFIGFSSLEANRYSRFPEVVKARLEGGVSLSGSIGVKYCPWCGTKLSDHYSENWKGLTDQKVIAELCLA